MRRKIVLLLFLIWLLPVKGYSFSALSVPGTSNLPPVTTPALVPYSCCSGTPPKCCYGTGPMATTSGVDITWAWWETRLISQIVPLGEAYESGQDKITAMFESGQDLKMKYLEDVVKGYMGAQNKLENVKNFGENSRVYGWEKLQGLKTSAHTGKLVEKDFQAQLEQEIATHSKSFKSGSSIVKRLSEQDIEEISASAILPVDKTLEIEDGQAMLETFKNIVDPFPALDIPDSIKNTGAAEQLDVLRKVRQSEIILPARVMESILAGYLPSLEMGDYLTEIYNEEGFEGVPEQVTSDGMVSSVGYLDFMSDMKFGNDAWMSDTSRNGIGAMRDVLELDSLIMEVERRKMERIMQIASLLAMSTLKDQKDLDKSMRHNIGISLEQILQE